jgi:gamma-glutamylcysteine synthetase
LAYPKGHGHLFDHDAQEIKLGDTEGKEAEEVHLMHRLQYERYEWFVSYMLGTSRVLLRQFYSDRYWRKTVERNIGYHVVYLKRRKALCIQDDYINLYGRQVTKMIDRAIKAAESKG